MTSIQKFFQGRLWWFNWAHLDADDNPVDDFADNTYCIAICRETRASGEAPLLTAVMDKDVEDGAFTGYLYGEIEHGDTESISPGEYLLYYQYLTTSNKRVTLAERKIIVERAPAWECE